MTFAFLLTDVQNIQAILTAMLLHKVRAILIGSREH
jgi:hypothetical protein